MCSSPFMGRQTGESIRWARRETKTKPKIERVWIVQRKWVIAPLISVSNGCVSRTTISESYTKWISSNVIRNRFVCSFSGYIIISINRLTHAILQIQIFVFALTRGRRELRQANKELCIICIFIRWKSLIIINCKLFRYERSWLFYTYSEIVVISSLGIMK